MRRAIGYHQHPLTAPSGPQDAAGPDASIVAAAERLGLELVRIYGDAATDPELALDARPGLVNALGMLAPGDTLLVIRSAALGADSMQMAAIERVVEKRGARLAVMPADGTPGPGPNAVTLRVREAFAEYEELLATTQGRAAPRPRRAPRVRPARTGATADDGRAAAAQDHDGPGDDAGRELAVLAVVRGHLQAGWGPSDIAEELTRRGLPSRDGSPWRAELVRTLLSRSAVGRVRVEPGFKRAAAFETAPAAEPRLRVALAR